MTKRWIKNKIERYSRIHVASCWCSSVMGRWVLISCGYHQSLRSSEMFWFSSQSPQWIEALHPPTIPLASSVNHGAPSFPPSLKNCCVLFLCTVSADAAFQSWYCLISEPGDTTPVVTSMAQTEWGGAEPMFSLNSILNRWKVCYFQSFQIPDRLAGWHLTWQEQPREGRSCEHNSVMMDHNVGRKGTPVQALMRWTRFQGQAMRKAGWHWTDLRPNSPLEVHRLDQCMQGQEGRTVYLHFCTVLSHLNGVAEKERECKTCKPHTGLREKLREELHCTISAHVFGETMGQIFIFCCYFLIFLSCLRTGAPVRGLGNAVHCRDAPWCVTKEGWGAIIIRGQF